MANYDKMFDLTGKGAFVVGGAGGLGEAIAAGLAKCGAKVAIAARNEEKLKEAAAKIKAETGCDVSYYTLDATSEESVSAVAKKANEDMGHVDILVNSQGYNKKFPAEEFPMDQFHQMLMVNVYSLMLTAKHFGQYMIKNGYGKIVNVSSTRGKIATRNPGNCGYCATKGATNMLTKQLASEYGKHGITVNALCPTVTRTPMMESVIEQRGGEAYLKKLAADVPMNKVSLPEDVVGTAVFLSAPASDYVTGNIVYPDGGLTCVG